MATYREQIDMNRIPTHVAVIMDGNGRWAKKQGKHRIFGHQNGVDSVDQVMEMAAELGVKYLTLYAFSTENWNRPVEEVNALMDLFVSAINSYLDKMLANNIRLLVIGDTDRLVEKTRSCMNDAIAKTAHCTGMTLVLAISYSSRWEMVRAVKNIALEVKNGTLNPDDIDDDCFANHLTTAGIPDPDLLIRTSGELRISNFLMWQISYSELYFTDISWPEFRKEEFCQAIVDFQGRERRFGKTGEQIKK